jgi:hypothetical protein
MAFLEKANSTDIQKYKELHPTITDTVFYTTRKEIREKPFTDFVSKESTKPRLQSSPDLEELMFEGKAPGIRSQPHTTRSTTKTRQSKGITFGCFTVQIYILLRLALLSFIPKTVPHFADIEHTLFKIFTSNITKDKFRLPSSPPFKGQTKDETIQVYFDNHNIDKALYENITSIVKITKLNVFENITMQTSSTMQTSIPNYINREYNSISLRNVETAGASSHYSGRTSRYEYIQFLIDKSQHMPIPMSFGYKYIDEYRPLAVDHWFVLWRGKIRTAWGDDAFGFKYYTSPIITAEFFGDVLDFLDSIRPDIEPSEQGKDIFRQFLREYMGIIPEHTHVYETYKAHFSGLSEEQLKIQASTELIEAYINTHTDIYFEEGEETSIQSNTPARLKTAAGRGFGGYDIFELKPEIGSDANEDYYILLQDCIRRLAELEIIEHLDIGLFYSDTLVDAISGKMEKHASQQVGRICMSSTDGGCADHNANCRTEVVSVAAASSASTDDFILEPQMPKKGGSRKSKKQKSKISYHRSRSYRKSYCK